MKRGHWCIKKLYPLNIYQRNPNQFVLKVVVPQKLFLNEINFWIASNKKLEVPQYLLNPWTRKTMSLPLKMINRRKTISLQPALSNHCKEKKKKRKRKKTFLFYKKWLNVTIPPVCVYPNKKRRTTNWTPSFPSSSHLASKSQNWITVLKIKEISS